MKELNKRRGISDLCIGTLNTIKMSVLLNVIYRFNAVAIKISGSY